MKKYRASKRFHFDAAHRLINYSGKCSNLHGHRYYVDVVVTVDSLNEQNMVIDFNDLTAVCGSWLDSNWDHKTILSLDDQLYYSLISLIDKTTGLSGLTYPVPFDGNPTAEAMSEFLFETFSSLLAKNGVSLESVCVWETPNSMCSFKGEGNEDL